jgi:transposase
MQIARIGLDLAKYVFEIHGVDAHGKTVLRKTLRRHAVSVFFANLPPCLVGLEASNGAHFWAKALSDLGHDVRLISPQFVTPYVKSNKNDRNDAEAICEAVGRPNMRFVPVKAAEQLASSDSQSPGRESRQAGQSGPRSSRGARHRRRKGYRQSQAGSRKDRWRR